MRPTVYTHDLGFNCCDNHRTGRVHRPQLLHILELRLDQLGFVRCQTDPKYPSDDTKYLYTDAHKRTYTRSKVYKDDVCWTALENLYDIPRPVTIQIGDHWFRDVSSEVAEQIKELVEKSRNG